MLDLAIATNSSAIYQNHLTRQKILTHHFHGLLQSKVQV